MLHAFIPLSVVDSQLLFWCNETRLILYMRGGQMNLTVRQAALELNVSVHTIRAWIYNRRIGYVRLGRAIRESSPFLVETLRDS